MPADPTAVDANAYSIAFRLLGDRAAARAAVGIAVERVQRSGGLDRPDWLALVAESTVAQAVGVAAAGTAASADDADGSLRAALRRRLAAASDPERAASALHHLAGYPVESVAAFMQRTPEDVAHLAGALDPPPGVSYRELGDPELVGRPASAAETAHRGISASTIVAVVVIVALALGASRCVGQRPTLGPKPAAVPVSVGPAEPSVASAGCGEEPQPPGVFSTMANSQTGTVPYRIAVPQSSTTPGAAPEARSPRPLLLAVADAGTDVEEFAAATGLEMRGVAEGQLVVTVAPPEAGTTAAVDGAAAVLDTVLQISCVDLARVTATGLGTGAQVATSLGCTRAEQVAVVAAVAGASLTPGCEISPAVSLLVLWAADDQVLLASGGYGPAAAPPSTAAAPLPASAAGQVVEDWSRQIGAGTPSRSTQPDGSAVEDATAPSGAAVRSVITASGGHSWPPAATDAILAFATDHARSS